MDVKALICDRFGTFVCCPGSVIDAGMACDQARAITADWTRFADCRRAGYGDVRTAVAAQAGDFNVVAEDMLVLASKMGA